jgi:hypothetical protein
VHQFSSVPATDNRYRVVSDLRSKFFEFKYKAISGYTIKNSSCTRLRYDHTVQRLTEPSIMRLVYRLSNMNFWCSSAQAAGNQRQVIVDNPII